jgi:transcription factor STE12
MLTGIFLRHKRTHSREDGGEGSLHLSAEEEEEFSGEEQLGSVEEASPTSESAFVPGSINAAVSSGTISPQTTMTSSHSFNSLQTLSMPMTISHPTPINAGGAM